MDTPTSTQINAWKKQHGEVYKITVEGKFCYLKKPSRKAIRYATTLANKDHLKVYEILLKDCWLSGDEEIQTNDSLFLSLIPRIDELFSVKESEMVKL